MSKFYMFLDFEFLPYTLKKNVDKVEKNVANNEIPYGQRQIRRVDQQARDVIVSGYVLTKNSNYQFIKCNYCSNKPVHINCFLNKMSDLNINAARNRINNNLKSVPDKRDILLKHLNNTTYRADRELLVNPHSVISPCIPEGITLVVYQGCEDVRILQTLLGSDYCDVNICNIRTKRTGESYIFILKDERSKAEYTVPFNEFQREMPRNWPQLSLSDAHQAICNINHGTYHNPLVDSMVLKCLTLRTGLKEKIHELF